jgi:CheY-like chemotaxis protein
MDVPAVLPLVWGDRARLRQVALNLVTNAVKFTARGEVALRVSLIANRLSPLAKGELPLAGDDPSARGDKRSAICVSVRDTGLGIPPQELEVIFDEFRQSERTTARGFGGMGLGLAICRRLIELHGGRIGAQSSGEEGTGSTFYFSLPAIPSPVEEAADGASSEDEVAPETVDVASPEDGVALDEQRRVLLLTDQAGGGERLREHLVRQGFRVEARRVDQSPDWLADLLSAPPGAVVLDVGSASGRGWELLQVLKGNPATRDIPVLFFSLTDEGGAVLELDYLTKPVGLTELAEALARQGLGCAEEGAPKTILLVDDDAAILDMHARVAQTQLPFCRVLRAQNGREALQVMRRERPDLVLLDLMMPELDGFGVLEAMQGEESMRDVPVIVLTGQVLTEEDMGRLDRGVTAVLGKGLFSLEETLDHVETALARQQGLGDETQRIVRRAMAYIHEHYAEPGLSRDDVARYVGVSKGYLSRCFHSETGLSPMTYLLRYRVNRGKALLLGGDKSVTDVAMAVGFSDAAYFSRVFRRNVGVTPGAYRLTFGSRK